MTVLPTAGDQLSAILNSIQSRPNLPAPSIFDQAAKPPSSLVHSPFVFGQPLSFQQPQLQSKSVSLTCLIKPFLKLCSEFYQLLIIYQLTRVVLFNEDVIPSPFLKHFSYSELRHSAAKTFIFNHTFLVYLLKYDYCAVYSNSCIGKYIL